MLLSGPEGKPEVWEETGDWRLEAGGWRLEGFGLATGLQDVWTVSEWVREAGGQRGETKRITPGSPNATAQRIGWATTP